MNRMRPVARCLVGGGLLVACSCGDSGQGDFATDGRAEAGADTIVDVTLETSADSTTGGPDATSDAPADVARDGGPADATREASKDGPDDASIDAPDDVPDDVPINPPNDALADGPPILVNPCQLPGAIQFTSGGPVTVDGGSPTWPSLAFLHLPAGFCAHYFGTVGNARQIRFAPGGELFVASPTRSTTGGGSGGLNAVVVLPDDDLDGVADSTLTFLAGMNATQGILFANGHFYYQDGTTSTVIQRLPYSPGDRSPSGPSEQVASITVYTSGLHWPRTLDVADDGTIYVGNGGDQGEVCNPAHPFHGGILQIDPAPGAHPNGIQVAKGLRNPIAVRCSRGHNLCFALELALDYSASGGGREKIIPIRPGDDWGFPCCATQNLPYPGSPAGTDCSTVAAEGNSLLIGDTPFGIDFESGKWASPWGGQAYAVTHGAAGGGGVGTWAGARLVAVPMNAVTGMLQPSTDISGNDVGMVDFATGWDDGTVSHGRPAAVSFSADGRLFVANDNDGVIFWIAPM